MLIARPWPSDGRRRSRSVSAASAAVRGRRRGRPAANGRPRARARSTSGVDAPQPRAAVIGSVAGRLGELGLAIAAIVSAPGRLRRRRRRAHRCPRTRRAGCPAASGRVRRGSRDRIALLEHGRRLVEQPARVSNCQARIASRIGRGSDHSAASPTTASYCARASARSASSGRPRGGRSTPPQVFVSTCPVCSSSRSSRPRQSGGRRRSRRVVPARRGWYAPPGRPRPATPPGAPRRRPARRSAGRPRGSRRSRSPRPGGLRARWEPQALSGTLALRIVVSSSPLALTLSSAAAPRA